jgi:hypothetical protein
MNDSLRNHTQLDYHDAIREMAKGNVVQYIGTINGPVWRKGSSFCMQRGVIFRYDPVRISYKTCGHMVYDPDFRYELTGEMVDPRGWPIHPESNKPTSGYARIGANNV